MWSTLLYYILKFFLELVQLVLTPIENLIAQYVPATSNVVALLNDFIDLIINFFPWIMSWFNIPGFVLGFIVDMIFSITVLKIFLHSVKVAIAWYNALKL